MATKTRKTPAAPATTVQAGPAPALQFIDLRNVRALDQVRTEFDEETLQELAESIKLQGMLQPVLLRPDPDAVGQFIIIAGERRVRAAHLAGLAAVPALVGEVDEAKAGELQLIENIQREELSLAETAAAVAKLYEKHQALKPIANLTGKSLPWVSKHLSAATKLNYFANQLLATGKTEDLELVLIVSQIEALRNKWYPRGAQLLDDIEEGRAGRTEARTLLATFKEEIAAENKKAKATKKTSSKKATTPQPEEWKPYKGMSDLADALCNSEFDIDATLAQWTDDQQRQMCGLLRKDWEAGNLAAGADKMLSMRRLAAHLDSCYHDQENVAAYILGANDIELNLRDLAVEWRAIFGR